MSKVQTKLKGLIIYTDNCEGLLISILLSLRISQKVDLGSQTQIDMRSGMKSVPDLIHFSTAEKETIASSTTRCLLHS
ncbi:hypothetical protein V6N13_062813 [Hibiscus sabdariffa]|uniref:Uncharacterized protein n=1 Tax=Hibiscus sabdariffa TaxID=183260 RepID=A0ABR2AJL9_9ROSI